MNTKKWPSKGQWKRFFSVLNAKEKIILTVFLILALGSIVFLVRTLYLNNTEIIPAKGGIHIEGVAGRPRFINPLYANSEVDRALTQLLFSGLMKYDKGLKVVPDLAERYKIEESGKVYKFYLKEGLKWQDGAPLTADDVVFTIRRIQDSSYKSPLLPNWVGVDVEKIGDSAIKFEIDKPYGAFIENCTVKILPKHIWGNVSAENFPLEIYNLKPIGSGPYKVKEIKQDQPNQIEHLTLSQNSYYHGKDPYISKINFLFRETEEQLIKEAKEANITGFSASLAEIIDQGWNKHDFSLPRYFAVFFNPEQKEIFKDKKVREALDLALNKKDIIKKVLGLKGEEAEKKIINSPLLPDIYGLEKKEEAGFDLEKARQLLDETGFELKEGLRQKQVEKERAFLFEKDLTKGSKGDEVEELQKCLTRFSDVYPEGEVTAYFGPKTEEAVKKFQEKYKEDVLDPFGLASGNGNVREGTREKLNEVCFEEPETIIPLKFSLVTISQPQMEKLGETIKDQWARIGVEVSLHKVGISQLEQNYIKPRDYNALLFGEVLGAVPDPFPFWHSSQIKDPGLNLALFENQEADKLMEEVRQNAENNKEKLEQLQEIILEQRPAIFIYSPDYTYFVSKEIKNVGSQKITDPSKRFLDIEEWYIKTKREWK